MSNVQMFKSNVQMFQRSNVQLFKCSNAQMFKCSNLQMFYYVQMFKRSNVQIIKCSNVQISKVKYQMSIRLNFCRCVPPEFLRSFFNLLHSGGGRWLRVLCQASTGESSIEIGLKHFQDISLFIDLSR